MKKILNLIFGVPYFLVIVRDKKAKAQRIDKGQFEAYKSNSMFDRKILIEVDFFNLAIIFDQKEELNNWAKRIIDEGENYKIIV